MLAVQQADFTLYDLLLFLDTHPDSTEALEYYREAKAEAERARSEYESLYGPLTMRSADGSDAFNWLSMPWPWEGEN